MRICPICGRSYDAEPAILRADNSTEICPTCGIAEALMNYKASAKKKEYILKLEAGQNEDHREWRLTETEFREFESRYEESEVIDFDIDPSECTIICDNRE